jgi:hypothetical protein
MALYHPLPLLQLLVVPLIVISDENVRQLQLRIVERLRRELFVTLRRLCKPRVASALYSMGSPSMSGHSEER